MSRWYGHFKTFLEEINHDILLLRSKDLRRPLLSFSHLLQCGRTFFGSKELWRALKSSEDFLLLGSGLMGDLLRRIIFRISGKTIVGKDFQGNTYFTYKSGIGEIWGHEL
jgi:hypothetical protein